MSCFSEAKTATCGQVFLVNKKENNDSMLVDRAKRGDISAFRQLVERYQHRVHLVALGVCGDFQDAQDVTQEAFIKAFRKLSSFRKQSSFYTWIYRIAYNLAIDQQRKRYRHTEISIGDVSELDRANGSGCRAGNPCRSKRPDTELETSELGTQIHFAIENLSSEHRAVILLREVDGLSYTEISEVVGCSKGTVMSRLHHARKSLQHMLTDVIGVWRKDSKFGKSQQCDNQRSDVA